MRAAPRWSAATVALGLAAACAPADDTRTVTGTVAAADGGAPLARAVIDVAGTLERTVAGDDGAFEIGLPAADTALLVRALGYGERRLRVAAADSALEVRLEPVWPAAMLESVASQRDDPDVRVTVEAPAYPDGRGPVVHVDEGHHNYHTITARYRVFADRLRGDGYEVRPFRAAFTPEALDDVGILVVATPFHGLAGLTLPTPSAFEPAEVDALLAWVRAGGSLLLVCDHMPIPGAYAALFDALGIRYEDGYAVRLADGEPVGTPLVFRRGDGLAAEHPITTGRGEAERVDAVATYTGFAFQADPPFEPLLVLPEDAVSLNTTVWGELEGPGVTRVPVGGWLQAATAELGSGRLVLLGEAAMLTAQVRGPDARPDTRRAPDDVENQQFLLNLLHWLSRLEP